MFITHLYLRLSVNRVLLRNVDTGQSVERAPDTPFSHPRMLVGDFISAQGAVKAAVADVRGAGFARWIRLLVHPTQLVDGGLSQVEDRVMRELASGAGAGKVIVWMGNDLSDDAVRAKLRDAG